MSPILYYVTVSVFTLTVTCSRSLSRRCLRGGYQDPNSCDRCRCPDGFGGIYCDDVAQPVKGK